MFLITKWEIFKGSDGPIAIRLNEDDKEKIKSCREGVFVSKTIVARLVDDVFNEPKEKAKCLVFLEADDIININNMHPDANIYCAMPEYEPSMGYTKEKYIKIINGFMCELRDKRRGGPNASL